MDLDKNYYSITNNNEIVTIEHPNQILNRIAFFSFPNNYIPNSITHDHKYMLNKIEYYKKHNFVFTLDNGGNLYEYLCNNTKLFDKNNISHKMHYEYDIKFTGDINEHPYETNEIIEKYKQYKHKGKQNVNGVMCINIDGVLMPYTDIYKKTTKIMKRYVFELNSGNLDELKSILCHRYNDRLVDYEHAVIKNDKLEIEESICKRFLNKKTVLCKNNEHPIHIKQFCLPTLCNVQKKHFHINGINVKCGCVRTYITFFPDISNHDDL